MCHFVDLCCYLAGSFPVKVHAFGLRNGKSPALQDSLVSSLAFANGAVASIVYVAEGDTAYPKELIEVFCGGRVMVIDDFRSSTIVSQGKTTRNKLSHIDKGHAKEMEAFINFAKGHPSTTLTFPDAVASTLATLSVVESLATGQAVDVARLVVGRE
jgi:polar amino acid transport system substrate-binding protein